MGLGYIAVSPGVLTAPQLLLEAVGGVSLLVRVEGIGASGSESISDRLSFSSLRSSGPDSFSTAGCLRGPEISRFNLCQRDYDLIRLHPQFLELRFILLAQALEIVAAMHVHQLCTNLS